MFNRNNLPSVPNPFAGARPDGRTGNYQQPPPPPRKNDYDTRMGGGYDSPPPPRKSDYDTSMGGAYDDPRGYGGSRDYPPSQSGRTPQKPMSSRPGGGSGGGGYRANNDGAGGKEWHLHPAKSPDNSYIYGNL